MLENFIANKIIKYHGNRVFIGPEIRAVARNSGFFKIWPEFGPNFRDNLSHGATISAKTLTFASMSLLDVFICCYLELVSIFS